MKIKTAYRSALSKNMADKPPCDNCPLADHCTEYQAACVLFLKFVEKSDTPRAFKKMSNRRNPTPEIYNYIFCGMDKLDTGRTDVKGRTIFVDSPEVIGLRRAAMRSQGVSV